MPLSAQSVGLRSVPGGTLADGSFNFKRRTGAPGADDALAGLSGEHALVVRVDGFKEVDLALSGAVALDGAAVAPGADGLDTPAILFRNLGITTATSNH